MDFKIRFRIVSFLGIISSSYIPCFSEESDDSSRKSKSQSRKWKKLLIKFLWSWAILVFIYFTAVKIDFIFEEFRHEAEFADRIATAGVSLAEYSRAAVVHFFCLVKVSEIAELSRLFNLHSILKSSTYKYKTFLSYYLIIICICLFSLVDHIVDNYNYYSKYDASISGTHTIPLQLNITVYFSYVHDILMNIMLAYVYLLTITILHELTLTSEEFFRDFHQAMTPLMSENKTKGLWPSVSFSSKRISSSQCEYDIFDVFDKRARDLRKIYGKVNSVLGVFLLTLIPVEVVKSIMLYYKAFTNYQNDIYYTPPEAFIDGTLGSGRNVILINCGYILHVQLKFWSSKLRRELLKCRNDYETSTIFHIRSNKGSTELNVLLDWNWKLNGCGYFNVDRPLISKIAATTLTYMIVLFQFHYSDSANPGHPCQCSCLDNNNTFRTT